MLSRQVGSLSATCWLADLIRTATRLRGAPSSSDAPRGSAAQACLNGEGSMKPRPNAFARGDGRLTGRRPTHGRQPSSDGTPRCSLEGWSGRSAEMVGTAPVWRRVAYERAVERHQVDLAAGDACHSWSRTQHGRLGCSRVAQRISLQYFACCFTLQSWPTCTPPVLASSLSPWQPLTCPCRPSRLATIARTLHSMLGA